MSERTDMERVEYGYRCWNEGDLEGLLTICDPEVEYHTSGAFPGIQSIYEGEDGIRRWWADFREPWREIKVIPEKIVERPGGVNVLVRFEGTGRQGIETTMHFINTTEIRDGLAYRFESQPVTDEAIRELGLD
jgi:ketosteroid isomerase-like protein